MLQINTVLMPVDGSQFSKEAVRYGAQLVSAHKPKVYLLHVTEPVHMTLGGANAAQVRQANEAKSMAMLETYKEILAPSGLDVTLLTRSGRPDYVILNVEEELACDLIVIGSRGLSVLESMVMGSVVTRVLEGAGCPVLVTRNVRSQ